jgi:TonB family protein
MSMVFRRSGRNLLALPMGISTGIHALLMASLIFLSWEKTASKPEVPPIKIAAVLLEPEKIKPAQEINRVSTLAVAQQKTSKPSKPTALETPQSFQPARRHTSKISRKGPLPIQPSTPRLVEFLSTKPAPSTGKTILRAKSSTTYTARTPTPDLGRTIDLNPGKAFTHSAHSFPSPREGITARTIPEEIFSASTTASPGIQGMERRIPVSKANAVQVASIPSDFVDDDMEEDSLQVSASSKSSPPGGETDSSGEDLDSIRKGFSSSVWGRIAKAKYYPPLARKRGWEGKPIIEFRLARNGELLSSSIALSSPYKILNEAALGAVKNAVPYPKFPEALKLDSIRFKLPISFILAEP